MVWPFAAIAKLHHLTVVTCKKLISAVLMCPCSIRSNGALDLLDQQQQVPSEAAGLLGSGVPLVASQFIAVPA
jgi:hypothetical protein